MTLQGTIRNGAIVLSSDSGLAEGTRIEVSIVKVIDAPSKAEASPSERETDPLLKYCGAIDNLPPDASENIDHYLYGAPKQ
jgi:hypothetical protein